MSMGELSSEIPWIKFFIDALIKQIFVLYYNSAPA
jgi:hypothetical protein